MPSQRSFQLQRRSPWPGQKLTGRMPKTTASRREPCPACPVDIKPGQRIGLLFDEHDTSVKSWAHLGCVIREVNRRNHGEQVAS